MAMTEVTTSIPMIIAWWIGAYHMAIATYIVFFAERRSPSLIMVGSVKGLLGAAIYIVVRDPPWSSISIIPDIILPITLLVLMMFSIIVTWLIWKAFDLDPPQKRFKELWDSFGDKTDEVW